MDLGSAKRKATGERWQLFQGDAFRLLTEMPDECVDGVVTDPPYSSGGMVRGDRMVSTGDKYVGNTNTKRDDFSGDNRDQRSFFAWLTLWLSECLRVSKRGGVVCVFSDWRQLPTVTDAVQSAGWVWLGIAPWVKPVSRPMAGRFPAASEYVVWGSSGPIGRAATIEVSKKFGVLPGWFHHAVVQFDKHHQTGKPSKLMAEVVCIVEPGGVVLDPFAGSASTGVGALREGRSFIGFELADGYFKTAAARLERWQCDDREYDQLRRKLRRQVKIPTRRHADGQAKE